MTVAEINAELRIEFENALYLVHDQSNVEAIEATPLAACAPQGAAYVASLLPPGCNAVVLVDVKGELEIRRIVGREAPHVSVYSLTLNGMSATTFLGFDPTRATTWTPAQAEAAREALIDLACTKAMRLSDATADAPAAFPVDVLPSMLRALVTEGARAMNVDPAFFGAPMLGVLAGAIGASRQVVVRPGWTEPSIVWVAIIGPSGCGKSAPVDVLTKPIRQHDADLQRRNALAQEAHASAVAAARQAKDGSAPPPPPPALHAVVDDVTAEALAVRLKDNPKGLLLASDELAAWFNGFDAYRSGKGGDEAKWLALFGGRALKVDRKGGGTLHVERPTVSVVGGSQPRVIARLLGRQQRESGFAARLLLACPPTRAALWSDERISDQTLRDWSFVVRSLLGLSTNDEPIGLPLSPEATALFRRWHDRSAEDGQTAAAAGNEDVAAANAKMRSIVPRIALVLALARAAEEGVAELLRVVDETAMRAAIALGDYFTGQARSLYARIHSEGTSTTGKVLGCIREAGDEGATRTNIRDALGRNASVEEVDEAIGTLLANRLIAPMPTVAGPGRPAERWRVA